MQPMAALLYFSHNLCEFYVWDEHFSNQWLEFWCFGQFSHHWCEFYPPTRFASSNSAGMGCSSCQTMEMGRSSE